MRVSLFAAGLRGTWDVSLGPYHMARITWPVSNRPHHMGRIKWPHHMATSNGRYRVARV